MRTALLLPLWALAACSASVSTEAPVTHTEPAPMTSTDPVPAPNTGAALNTGATPDTGTTESGPSWARTELDRAAPAEFETATFALG